MAWQAKQVARTHDVRCSWACKWEAYHAERRPCYVGKDGSLCWAIVLVFSNEFCLMVFCFGQMGLNINGFNKNKIK